MESNRRQPDGKLYKIFKWIPSDDKNKRQFTYLQTTLFDIENEISNLELRLNELWLSKGVNSSQNTRYR
jgi:hypothetical protein